MATSKRMKAPTILPRVSCTHPTARVVSPRPPVAATVLIPWLWGWFAEAPEEDEELGPDEYWEEVEVDEHGNPIEETARPVVM